MKQHEDARSNSTIIQSDINIKSWLAHLPTVDKVRPKRCPKCGAASCPIGGPLVLHGHGKRERQVLGPIEPNAKPTMVLIWARRYLCTKCGTVVVVVPREVRAKRLYSASAIGFGLALWGLMNMTTRVVREHVNPARFVAEPNLGWATVRRWAKNVAEGKLFVERPRPPPNSKLRDVARATASALAASAGTITRGLPLEHRAFFGAAHVA